MAALVAEAMQLSSTKSEFLYQWRGKLPVDACMVLGTTGRQLAPLRLVLQKGGMRQFLVEANKAQPVSEDTFVVGVMVDGVSWAPAPLPANGSVRLGSPF